ncbi:uncharacterized protein LOC109802607 [Cajanus cajan]|uniref:uncharacterized protein LOC109802607 n=1 Tax=Cajanus cajan TaxID=3821 RepID=UPI00098DA0A8|nr:uncharacterized protein LOC109802607 [Cajanus cajan]
MAEDVGLLYAGTRMSRQKSYADKRRKPLEFAEGEHVFLKVTPTTGVGRVLKARKLTPRFLRKYVHDPSHVMELDDVQVKENLTFEKLSVAVIDRKLKELRGKSIALVKVLWDAATSEATWEVEQ